MARAFRIEDKLRDFFWRIFSREFYDFFVQFWHFLPINVQVELKMKRDGWIDVQSVQVATGERRTVMKGLACVLSIAHCPVRPGHLYKSSAEGVCRCSHLARFAHRFIPISQTNTVRDTVVSFDRCVETVGPGVSKRDVPSNGWEKQIGATNFLPKQTSIWTSHWKSNLHLAASIHNRLRNETDLWSSRPVSAPFSLSLVFSRCPNFFMFWRDLGQRMAMLLSAVIRKEVKLTVRSPSRSLTWTWNRSIELVSLFLLLIDREKIR